ncbi:tetratricopeptide repeat protein SKI3 isoform X2 [Neltuma alba]|uniref:tetratricopeptide repeat protein SKI3 isoform X2 n=1 Tax=Neltuma alba TaxID=207710 RepID=UPI0010A53CB2|nr:tetratricopeptide repeat protein SKI3 isoform X2 [Prosopis alba]
MDSQTRRGEEVAEHDKEDALIRRLQESLDAHPDDASLRLEMGIFLWEKGTAKETMENAAEHFLISAKLNPENGDAFKFLGHYYRCVSGNAQRALKCYQRAVALNPDDSDSGEAFCNLLDDGGKENLEVAICREASEKSPKAFWAFRRLGYLQVYQEKWTEAVQSLQHALRGYPTCADLWEALGLAYQRLGRFTAAIKSYGRSLELDNTRVFALVESGNIFLTLGTFEKGVDHFRQALEISPHCVSAQYGLAFGLLGFGKNCINRGAYRWGASILKEASQFARTCTYIVKNISCIWTLHADIQLAYAKCFPWINEAQELESDEEGFKASILSWKKTCSFAARDARVSYQRALHLAPWQANIYADIALSSYLISSLDNGHKQDLNAWKLSEKMSMGALLLESDNYEFWVALAHVSDHSALKQHALIRGLQLNVSAAISWGYLGKLYRKEGEKLLARQIFDRARSIDPGLSLPWASMSAECHTRELAAAEGFESCLRAAQIMPLAEFQIGLTKLALRTGHLSSSQVFGAIQQAVQRAPQYPESHNLNGLVFEARKDYQSAAASYRLARHAMNTSSCNVPNSQIRDVSINLLRALSKAGNTADALQECEHLKKEGALDVEGLQVYILSLWQLGENDMALSVARSLAAGLSRMEKTCVATSICFICRLLYSLCGLDAVIAMIVKMPKELFLSAKASFVLSAIHALDGHNDHLGSVVSSSRSFLTSHEEIARMHFLVVLGKLVKNGSECFLGVQSGVMHLRKALHMFPNSNLLRNLLGYLLLSCKERNNCHTALRCCKLDHPDLPNQEGFKSASDIHGAGAIACYAIGNNNSKLTFPTCTKQYHTHPKSIRYRQKCFHQKPWNHNARYLLVLNYLQRAREENFPHHLCVIINRLIFVALSNELYCKAEMSCQYQQFQLLLCASEISLRCGDQVTCITHAKKAAEIVLADDYLFFAHLMLCRAYAMKGDLLNLQKEYTRCLELRTDCLIGWICLKLVESRYELKINSNAIDLNFEESVKKGGNLWKMWMAVYNLVRGLISLQNGDLLSAEELVAQACLLVDSESCLYLCHGAICMGLGRQCYGSLYLSQAAKSLAKVYEHSISPLPLARLLLAQAEASLGSKENWVRNLGFEWHSWPPELRPAELFFQMHLLARQSTVGSDTQSSGRSFKSLQQWVLQAIHTNPSCMRYWRVLVKLTGCE